MTDDERLLIKMNVVARNLQHIDDDPEYVEEVWRKFFENNLSGYKRGE